MLAGNACARGGLGLSAAAVTGVAWLLFDVVVSPLAGWIAAGVAAALFVGVWWLVPVVARGRSTLARTPEHSPRSS